MATIVNVSNSYIRLMPPMMKMTAGFMKINNNSDKSIKIIKVTSNLSKFTEMHTHKLKKDGTAVMSQLDFISIDANSYHILKKGGDHIMFIGLQKKLKEGEIHNLTLYLDDGTTTTVSLEVKKL
jgi:copper(I)-binding protein